MKEAYNMGKNVYHMAVGDKTVILLADCQMKLQKIGISLFGWYADFRCARSSICSTHICKHLEVEKALFYAVFKA